MGVTEQITWVPLIEYSVKKGVSLSTLRRYIKADKIEYRVKNGKYFVPDDGEDTFQYARSSESKKKLEKKIERLENELTKAQQEIVELKTLIAVYEEQIKI
ncbi:MAG: hypothetical protein CL678_12810 [Bdellovibrionaceae bacterium]|nr:hypothetical protein [Pseudobdellovibrionaceae bacterium]|tara:strand:- start:10064 stop:10366 length:303 start_codon:yes stop_codon:yes gene_type:complete